MERNGTGAPRVELIYDGECPNVDAARARLRTALAEAGLAPAWDEHLIGAPDLPDHARGYGSPTILVEGHDVAGEVAGSDACCRIYDDGGHSVGVPQVERVVEALRAALPHPG